MEIFNRVDELPSHIRGGVLSIGKFDGLHLGHARIISSARATARRRGAMVVVFTFHPSPMAILRPESAPAPITDPDTKRALLERSGVDALIEFPTTREFLSLTAEEFFSEIVVERLGAVAITEGASFAFGRDRVGPGSGLEELAARFGVELDVAQAVRVGETVVSSSAIRNALARGDVECASKLLGRRYAISGVVEHGDARGQTLGYPTANVADPGVFLPREGIYAARARMENGEIRAAAVNLGGNPTFGVAERKIEAHLLDYRGDLYGVRLELEFCARLRDVVQFSSKEALLAQMARDVDDVRRLVR